MAGLLFRLLDIFLDQCTNGIFFNNSMNII